MTPRLHRWQRFLEPRIFIPVLLCLALLAFALGITDLPRVFDRLCEVSLATVVNVLGLTLVYLILKGVQLRILLGHLDIHVPWRPLILAFAIGEMTLTVPSGVYAQNYVLQRLGLAEFARSAAATTITLAIEGAILVMALMAIGVPGWAWLRPLVLALCALMTAMIVAIAHSSRISQWINRLAAGGRLAKPARGLIDIVEGVRVNMVPRVLLPCVLLGLIYMAALVDGLVVVAHGTGLSDMTFTQAASIYFFSLGIAMAVGGVLTQLGVIEVAGLGAAKAWGYDLSDALAMLLGFRLLWMGWIWILCGTASAGLWRLFPRSGVDRGQEAAN
ncbi:MAG: lysylphosphatidylglycerol synthase domain-containing protein [Gammaproteobacteria bacterium]